MFLFSFFGVCVINNFGFYNRVGYVLELGVFVDLVLFVRYCCLWGRWVYYS